jgi:hypothetical protein
MSIYNMIWVRSPYDMVHMLVLEEYSGSIFTGHQKMEAVCPDRYRGSHQSVYTVP